MRNRATSRGFKPSAIHSKMELMKSLWARFIKSDKAILIALLILAAIPRLYLLLVTEKFSADGVSYLSTALYIRDPELIGEVPKRIYFILYPLLTLLFDFFIRNITLSGRILNFLVGIAIPPLTFLVGRRFLKTTPSIIAALFCIFNPFLIEQSAEIRGDNLFALMTLLSIYVFESRDWSKPNLRDALMLGAVIGLSQLARSNGMMYLLVVIPIWIMWIKAGKIQFKPWLLHTLIPFLVVFFVIFSIPYLLLMARGEKLPSMFVYVYLDGNITATQNREDLFFKLNLDATEYQFLEDVAQTEMRDLLTDLSILPKKYAGNFLYCLRLVFDPIIEILLHLSIFLLPLLFYVFYYWGDVKTPSGLKRIIFWAWPSFFLLPAIKIENLYFLPLIPVLMLVLAWFIVAVSELGWIAKWRVYLLAILMLTVLIPECNQSVKLLDAQARYVNPYIPAGKWINENSNMQTTIMARHPEVFFHAFRHGYRMPNEDLNRTLIFSLHKGITYIVFGPVEIDKRKQLFYDAYYEIHSMGDKARIKLAHTVDTGHELVYILELVPENFKVTEFPETEVVQ